MKIIKRCNYKIKVDELICVNLSEKYAKIICKILNEKHKGENYFFQVVSDNFECKR